MSSSKSDQKIEQSWPADALEYLGHCPLCQSSQRSIFYEGLQDRIFFCAPGLWTLYRCGKCCCAYLDPRPIPRSIGLAYEQYYTHDTIDKKNPSNSFKKIKQLAKNGYLNRVWKASLSPASKILGILLPPSVRAFLDEEVMRHLPRPGTVTERRLLDVGCGGGQFLLLAKNIGWHTMGFDSDPKAVEVARSSGLEVYLGGFESLPKNESGFDAITVNHVIEHVYDPQQLLAHCYRLLKSGGYFWIETPNIDSFGHSEFKSAWRGLEPPRHLQLFSWVSLKGMLDAAGFKRVVRSRWRPEYSSIRATSMMIKYGRNSRKIKPLFPGIFRDQFVEFGNRMNPAAREFITYQATK